VAREVVANQELSAGLAADVREEELLEPILPNAHVKPAAGGTGVPRPRRSSSAPGLVVVLTFVHHVGREELSSCRATEHDADGCLAVVSNLFSVLDPFAENGLLCSRVVTQVGFVIVVDVAGLYASCGLLEVVKKAVDNLSGQPSSGALDEISSPDAQLLVPLQESSDEIFLRQVVIKPLNFVILMFYGSNPTWYFIVY